MRVKNRFRTARALLLQERLWLCGTLLLQVPVRLLMLQVAPTSSSIRRRVLLQVSTLLLRLELVGAASRGIMLELVGATRRGIMLLELVGGVDGNLVGKKFALQLLHVGEIVRRSLEKVRDSPPLWAAASRNSRRALDPCC